MEDSAHVGCDAVTGYLVLSVSKEHVTLVFEGSDSVKNGKKV